MNPDIQIYGEPKFRVPLTMPMVDFLSDRADQHYDATCRGLTSTADGSGRINGLLTIWRNHLQYSADGEQVYGNASFRELDLLVKVLEMTAHLSDSERMTAAALSSSFLGALRMANSAGMAWRATSLFLAEPVAK